MNNLHIKSIKGKETLTNLVNKLLDHCEIEKNQSPKTRENYKHYLGRFLDFIPNNLKPHQIDLDLVQDYRLHLNRIKDKRGEPLAKKTQNYHIIALRVFLRFLAKNDIESLAADKIDLIKNPDREIDFLDREEVERLFAALDPKSKTFLRDRAILETLYSTGLRVSELRRLNVDKVDTKNREFFIVGKGGKSRIVFISPHCAEVIESYINSRKDNLKPLFLNLRTQSKEIEIDEEKGRLTTVAIQNIVRNTALKSGIVKKVTPHVLRHSFATDLLRNGADIRSVQELLGHASINTTQIYTHITNPKLRETYDKHHRSEKKP